MKTEEAKLHGEGLRREARKLGKGMLVWGYEWNTEIKERSKGYVRKLKKGKCKENRYRNLT